MGHYQAAELLAPHVGAATAWRSRPQTRVCEAAGLSGQRAPPVRGPTRRAAGGSTGSGSGAADRRDRPVPYPATSSPSPRADPPPDMKPSQKPTISEPSQ